MYAKQGIAGVIITLGTGLIALLWFYASISKLTDISQYAASMRRQPFGSSIQSILIYTLPVIELLIGTGLLSSKFSGVALWASAVLLLLFTGYIGLILIKVFGHIPCSCGGIIGQFGWRSHLWFNLSFLALNLITIVMNERKERRDEQ